MAPHQPHSAAPHFTPPLGNQAASHSPAHTRSFYSSHLCLAPCPNSPSRTPTEQSCCPKRQGLAEPPSSSNAPGSSLGASQLRPRRIPCSTILGSFWWLLQSLFVFGTPVQCRVEFLQTLRTCWSTEFEMRNDTSVGVMALGLESRRLPTPLHRQAKQRDSDFRAASGQKAQPTLGISRRSSVAG